MKTNKTVYTPAEILQALVTSSLGQVAYSDMPRPPRGGLGLAADEPPLSMYLDGRGVHDADEDETYYERAMEEHRG